MPHDRVRHEDGSHRSSRPIHTALIIIPGINYFYSQMGRRLAEALRHLGVETDIHTLSSYTLKEYEWCFIINTYEVVFSFGNESGGLSQIKTIKRHCGQIATVLLECIRTRWFQYTSRVNRLAGIALFLDGGMVDQSRLMPARSKIDYRFFFNGLLESERERARAMLATDDKRPIPWVLVGHLTHERVRLVERLVRTVDPSGFVYLPHLAPVTEAGPHLNEQQFQRVLESARYQVWCSHHRHFYMEGERFRASLLAGGLPIKVMLYPWDTSLQIPFDYLLMEETTFDAQLSALDFLSVRRRFAEDFFALPSLEQSLGELLQIPNIPAATPNGIVRQPDAAAAPAEPTGQRNEAARHASREAISQETASTTVHDVP